MNHAKLLLIISFLYLSKYTNATHVLGADIQCKQVSKDTLIITLAVYKDCKGVSLSPIAISVVGIGCSYRSNHTPTQIGCGDVTPISKKSCTKCNKSNCNSYGYPNGGDPSCTFPYGVERIVFQERVIITNDSCCKIRIEYSQCCRSNSVTNCCAGDNFYSYAEFDRCLPQLNNSPTFANSSSGIFCVGNCIAYDFSGSDIDGDSLSYELSSPLTGLGFPCKFQGQYTYQYPLYYDGFPSIKN